MKKKKVIKSLKKKLKILVIDQPQTKELMVLQKEMNDFEKDTLNLKAKILQLTQEKEQLEQQVKSPAGSQVLPQISTDGITEAMSQVSLKDEEIKGLKENILKLQQEEKNLHKSKKSLQQTIDKQKLKMNEKLQLQGSKHVIWDQITVEVTKLWDFLNFVEDKIVLVVISLVKYEVANELMQRTPSEKAQNSITFLSHLSNQDLATLNIHERMGIIIRSKQFIEKHKLMNNVKTL